MTELFIPPHSIESEQSVLGGLMISHNAFDEIADLVSEKDFYRAEHQLIFRHISRLVSSGKPVDVITVADSIESTGKLDRIDGGLSYLGSLVQNVPSLANIKSYAKIVRTKRKERVFQETAMEIAEISRSSVDVQNKVENAIEILTSLADDSQSQYKLLREAATKAIELIEARYESGNEIHGLKTHFKEFDRKTGGLQHGDLIIIAGRPSMGKSAFAVNIAENVAIKDNLPVLIFSLEMSDQQLATRAIANQGSVDMNVLRSARIQDNDWDGISYAVRKISDAPLIIDSNPMTTATQMHARARKIKRKQGLSLVVIDYLQLMNGSGDGNNRNEDLSEITRGLKLMAKDLGIPVIALSQLNRNLEQRADKRPINADLRESGAIEQDGDLIVMLYRDDVYNSDSPNKGLAEAIITKQRMGPIGTVLLQFQGEYSRFSDFHGEYQKPEKKQVRRGMDLDGKSQAAGQ